MKKRCLHCKAFLGKYAFKKPTRAGPFNYVYVCRKCGKVSVFNYVTGRSYAPEVKL
jgi:uncharacterized protein with PIN domain